MTVNREIIIAAIQEIMNGFKKIQKELGAEKITFIDRELPKHREDPEVEKRVQEENERKYKISKNPCKKCGMAISWDGYDRNNPTPPIHVDSDGYMLGDGSCPSYIKSKPIGDLNG